MAQPEPIEAVIARVEEGLSHGGKWYVAASKDDLRRLIAASQQQAKVSGEVEDLKVMLAECVLVFTDYAKQHFAKETEEGDRKGAANQALARRCRAALAAQPSGEGAETTALCENCPPVGYPTDKTRCTPCPRRAAQPQEPSA